MLRGCRGTLTKLLQSSLQYSSLRSRFRAANTSKRCISSLGSGFDGSSFSDDEDNYEEIRTNHRGYGEPGSVTLRGDQDANIDEFNKVGIRTPIKSLSVWECRNSAFPFGFFVMSNC